MSTGKNIRNCSVNHIHVEAGEPLATDSLAWHIHGNTGTGVANYLGTTDNQPLIIATNGNISEGTKFNTDGSIDFLNAENNIMLGSSGSNMAGGFNNIVISSTGTNAMIGTENNCISIGTDTEDLSFQGNNGVITIGSNASTRTFIKGITGHIGADSTGVFINAYGDVGALISSKRYKENIVDMGNESSFIYDLQPVLFNYIELPNEQSYGLIAEQVYEVRPDIVIHNKKGEIETIQTQYLEPCILNELQKQKKIIDMLITRIGALESKL